MPIKHLNKYDGKHYVTHISHLIFQLINYTLNFDTTTDYRNVKEKNVSRE